LDFKIKKSEKGGEITLKEQRSKSSSSSSLGMLTAGARSLSRSAKSLLSLRNHNCRDSNSRSSGSAESSLDRKKSLLLGPASNNSSRRTTSRKSKNGKSNSDKIFKATQAETLAMLVEQELNGMDY
jgi:hypothetical protein